MAKELENTYVDSHGVILQVGDTVIYLHSNNRGNTALSKGVITSFTKTGRARIATENRYWDTPDRRWYSGASIATEPGEKTLLCHYAKGHES